MRFPRPESIELQVPGLEPGLRLFVHGEQDRHVSQQLRKQGIWEPYETSLVLSILKPGDVFVDVGANIGYFSVIAASVVGEGGSVFAFEPDPDNCRLLEYSAELNKLQQRIELSRAGLSSRSGKGRLYLSEDNLGDHQIYSAEPGRRSLPVALYNGAQYLRPKLSQMALLKVDVQGAEYDVMQGLMPLLQEMDVPPRILIELTPLSLRQAGASGRALIELLAGLEQPLWIVDHVQRRLVLHPAQELAQWCDDVDAVAGDTGFMNILVGEAPPGTVS